MRKITLFALFAVLAFTACSDDDPAGMGGDEPALKNNINRNATDSEPRYGRLEFPHVKGGRSIVRVYTAKFPFTVNYSVEWDGDKKSQRWSCYQMYSGYSGSTGRYTPPEGERQYPWDDGLAIENRWEDDLFVRSGFDHGHICPSADRTYDFNANKQTFYMTNMQPQYNNFNAKLWADMESYVRKQTPFISSDTLYVCKGGTIDKEDQIMSRVQGKMIVPKYFFMALLRKNAQGYKALAFWVEHKNVNLKGDALGKYVINVRDLEKRTGIDFFCNLSDDIEEKVETLPAENVKKAWGL